MNQYATPAELKEGSELFRLNAQFDVANANATFLIRKIRSASAEVMDALTPEYDNELVRLYEIEGAIAKSRHRTLLIYRTLGKRTKYLFEYLTREYNQRAKHLKREAESAAVKKRNDAPSTRSARLIAKFIIDEAVKLNLRHKPKHEQIYLTNKVSEVPPTEFAPVESITPSEALTAIAENKEKEFLHIDFLDGMTEAL